MTLSPRPAHALAARSHAHVRLCLSWQAYCDAGLVSEVVVPLLSMQSSVLLCISTLLDGSNHYSKMIALRDETGKPVFESIAISLVCDACLKSDHPEKCTHRMSEVPRWISSKKVEVVRTLLREDPESSDWARTASPGDYLL